MEENDEDYSVKCVLLQSRLPYRVRGLAGNLTREYVAWLD